MKTIEYVQNNDVIIINTRRRLLFKKNMIIDIRDLAEEDSNITNLASKIINLQGIDELILRKYQIIISKAKRYEALKIKDIGYLLSNDKFRLMNYEI